MIRKSALVKFLILIFLTILSLILLKNNELKTYFYEFVYNDNINFAQINKWYQNKFGGVLPFSKLLETTTTVFNEKLNYREKNKYKDGVSLNVGEDYLVPSLDSGIVIFIGEKEEYGNTVIIQQENGIDLWYCNLKEINLKLYDYIKEGSLIGVSNENLYLVFTKNGEILDYQKYI